MQTMLSNVVRYRASRSWNLQERNRHRLYRDQYSTLFIVRALQCDSASVKAEIIKKEAVIDLIWTSVRSVYTTTVAKRCNAKPRKYKLKSQRKEPSSTLHGSAFYPFYSTSYEVRFRASKSWKHKERSLHQLYMDYSAICLHCDRCWAIPLDKVPVIYLEADSFDNSSLFRGCWEFYIRKILNFIENRHIWVPVWHELTVNHGGPEFLEYLHILLQNTQI